MTNRLEAQVEAVRCILLASREAKMEIPIERRTLLGGAVAGVEEDRLAIGPALGDMIHYRPLPSELEPGCHEQLRRGSSLTTGIVFCQPTDWQWVFTASSHYR